jgi:hypothetical protein
MAKRLKTFMLPTYVTIGSLRIARNSTARDGAGTVDAAEERGLLSGPRV